MRRRINDSTRFPYDPVSRFVRSTTIDAPCPASIGGTRDWFFVDRCRHAAKSLYVASCYVATSRLVVTLLRHATFAVICHNLRSVDDALGGLFARVNKRHVNASGFLNVPSLDDRRRTQIKVYASAITFLKQFLRSFLPSVFPLHPGLVYIRRSTNDLE